RIDPAALSAHDLRAAMLDQETGIRGYALAAERSFLEPYWRGLAAQTDLSRRLHGLLDDDAALAESLARTEQAMDLWRRETAEATMAAIERGDRSVASTSFQEAGRTRFDAVRAA